MSLALKYIYDYLKNEDIHYDEKEFSFQVQSNPHFPSLLSVVETLTFFKVPNKIFKLSFEQIMLLPDCFVSVLKKANGEEHPFLIKKKENSFVIIDETQKETLTLNNLKVRWTGFILLLDQPILKERNSNKGFDLKIPLSILLLCSFYIVLSTTITDLKFLPFFILPILGLLASMLILKDLFSIDNQILNKFCETGSTRSCQKVVNKTSFKGIKLSDVCFVFFSFQLISSLLIILTGNTQELFSFFYIIGFSTIPVILYSIYHQKFISKNWCPLCLTISSILIIELLYIHFSISIFQISLSLIPFLFISALVSCIGWYFLKNLLTTKKKLTESQVITNRLVRNYKLFKNTLFANPPIDEYTSEIQLGDKNARLVLTAIISPYCGPCETMFKAIENILDTYDKDIRIDLIIKRSEASLSSEETNTFFKNLLAIYFNKGEAPFLNAMSSWFSVKDETIWNEKHTSHYDPTSIESVYKNQHAYCQKNNINYTPTLFVNGYEYPNMYEHSDIIYFLGALLDDM
ncbi:vitamin K epoxide reductase family protein [uncultured Dokdonia sp.]|uniref:vitamin K epoxide reductase family protein n=1 Tax=uncultured Dokdonia sp. TaxID=575653 RepID=UPI002611B202|nr:vitamin K epoxide reductase family protein [uncultured Dokdonia sp.]